jgi:hypothetical protein
MKAKSTVCTKKHDLSILITPGSLIKKIIRGNSYVGNFASYDSAGYNFIKLLLGSIDYKEYELPLDLTDEQVLDWTWEKINEG